MVFSYWAVCENLSTQLRSEITWVDSVGETQTCKVFSEIKKKAQFIAKRDQKKKSQPLWKRMT